MKHYLVKISFNLKIIKEEYLPIHAIQIERPPKEVKEK